MSKKPEPDVTVFYHNVLTELKQKFPGNNAASWRRNSKKQLAAWYAEYILEDVTKTVKII